MTGDEKPNEHGAILAFVDDFDEWEWEDRDKVTDISARAVRSFIREVSESCAFVIYPSHDDVGGGRIILTALHCDIQIEADLGATLRDFATNDGWHEDEKAAFKRMLQDVLKVMSV